ncbi:MAG: hypothetical protein K0R08_2259 [Solimicrobium sp.]|jgi:hypothetical protein|nr:hypothetical protein [Solimicrobium sp.]
MQMIFPGLVNQRYIIPISKYAFISSIVFSCKNTRIGLRESVIISSRKPTISTNCAP